ncbi:hypothetical protein PFISCL1PPCAC_21542, partial [Pristionchus fissidentatus]
TSFDRISTNLVDDGGSLLEVATITTPRVRTAKLRDSGVFIRFEKSLAVAQATRQYTDPGLNSIGKLVAPSVILPPSHSSIHMLPAHSTEGVHPSGNAPRFRLVSSQRMTEGKDAAAAAFTIANPSEYELDE